MIIHVVSSGETLWSLARRYNVSINSIQQTNQLPNPSKLLIGQSLVIPTPALIHMVKKGETLWSIAKKYGITVNAIISANQLSNSSPLYIGTRLYIPPIAHVVQPGETLWQIAKLYNTSMQAIIDQNQIQNPNALIIGTQLIIPRTRPTIEVNAFTYQSDAAGAQSLKALGPLLTYASPFAYKVTATGTLEPFADTLMLSAAKFNQIMPMMAITNFTSTEKGSNLMHVIFTSDELQKTLIQNIVQVMDEKGYKGVNIDFENVLPEDRQAYNKFLQLVVDSLHPKGYFVSTSLAPKTSEQQGGLLYTAHDYAAHGKIADFVVLMTYEWGYRAGPPQAISPINKMREVVEYALSVIPAKKIFLGFQIYARDWKIPFKKGQQAETFSPQEAIRLATQHNATIQYDVNAQSPYFYYIDDQGQNHVVWFEDARSAQAKFDLAKEYNLRGISYWALGYPYPQNWVLLDDNFKIRKLLST